MDKIELRKGNGDVFLEARRMPDNSFIMVSWIGIQSMETVVMGGNNILALLQERPCPGMLNSNKELIGPWEEAVNWLAFKWAPKAKAAGLQYLAHVLSPGVYGQKSFEALYPKLASYLQVETFQDERSAQAWLQAKFQQYRAASP
ncbi:MAG: hypothetical protein ACO1O1_04475 [Adhaeribacter sp.]